MSIQETGQIIDRYGSKTLNYAYAERAMLPGSYIKKVLDPFGSRLVSKFEKPLVVDVGCGLGLSADRLAKKFHCRALRLDLSLEALEGSAALLSDIWSRDFIRC